MRCAAICKEWSWGELPGCVGGCQRQLRELLSLAYREQGCGKIHGAFELEIGNIAFLTLTVCSVTSSSSS